MATATFVRAPRAAAAEARTRSRWLANPMSRRHSATAVPAPPIVSRRPQAASAPCARPGIAGSRSRRSTPDARPISIAADARRGHGDVVEPQLDRGPAEPPPTETDQVRLDLER